MHENVASLSNEYVNIHVTLPTTSMHDTDYVVHVKQTQIHPVRHTNAWVNTFGERFAHTHKINMTIKRRL